MAVEHESALEANRLYWETDTPVSEIAERLNLSRRALYDVLEEVPAGATCTRCGGDLVYENRSARTAGEPVCSQCGARPGVDTAAAPLPEEVDAAAVDPRTVRLGGAMLVGAIVGAVATLIAVPRR